MGELITLSDRRVLRPSRAPRAERRRAEFFFDLSCPFSYLAAERVEQAFISVTWTPASEAVLRQGSLDASHAVQARAAAERRAAELRMPLVWPETYPADVTAAMRAAAFAAEHNRGAAFVLAAGRLAFCGGFDLEDPETLAEAAAAAGVSLKGCLEAAGDTGRDGRIEGAGRRLLAAGADRLPALKVGRALYWGEGQVSEATAAARLAATAVR
jgi:2-hydroxychromene-2-carboxylate isomerase